MGDIANYTLCQAQSQQLYVVYLNMSTKKQKHYINNGDFLKALIDYKAACKDAKKNKKPQPAIPNYIGECFMKIAEGLSHKIGRAHV